MSAVEIPSILDTEAPGVACFFHSFANGIERDLLERLVSAEGIQAWCDTGANSKKWKWKLSADQLYDAQFLLAYWTCKAPDIPPIGHQEIDRSHAWFSETRTRVGELANRFREASKYDHLIEEEWLCYRNFRPDDTFLQGLTYSFQGFAKALDYYANFLDKRASLTSAETASPSIRPEGPRIRVVQQPGSEQALKRTVILRIGGVCRDKFGQPMYSVVDTLARLRLGCAAEDMPAARGVLQDLWAGVK